MLKPVLVFRWCFCSCFFTLYPLIRPFIKLFFSTLRFYFSIYFFVSLKKQKNSRPLDNLVLSPSAFMLHDAIGLCNIQKIRRKMSDWLANGQRAFPEAHIFFSKCSKKLKTSKNKHYKRKRKTIVVQWTKVDSWRWKLLLLKPYNNSYEG